MSILGDRHKILSLGGFSLDAGSVSLVRDEPGVMLRFPVLRAAQSHQDAHRSEGLINAGR